jgi:hypothetical protein
VESTYPPDTVPVGGGALVAIPPSHFGRPEGASDGLLHCEVVCGAAEVFAVDHVASKLLADRGSGGGSTAGSNTPGKGSCIASLSIAYLRGLTVPASRSIGREVVGCDSGEWAGHGNGNGRILSQLACSR